MLLKFRTVQWADHGMCTEFWQRHLMGNMQLEDPNGNISLGV
jgi:hypothetical protein